eukprot:9490998-Pyramimonas_sp.AAC.2
MSLSCRFLLVLVLLPHISCVVDISIDGGRDGWDRTRWYMQADTVMGGRSSGSLTYLENNCPSPGFPPGEQGESCSPLYFSGDISLIGGGFNSIRRPISPTMDMSAYTGIVISADAVGLGQKPVAFHLRVSSADQSSAWCVF